MSDTDSPRFLRLADVAQTLNISSSQVYALVRSGDLPAIKIGGRGQWRVETARLEEWIARTYEDTRRFIEGNPFPASDEALSEPPEETTGRTSS